MAKDNPAPPSLSDLLDLLKQEILRDINCVQIGMIEDFSPSSQTATIRLALKHVVEVQPDGKTILKERPLLGICPVFVLGGGSGHVSVPIAPGDTCIVLFNDREIDRWLADGGVQAPTTDRMHDLSDAIALVGIRNLQNALDDYRQDGVQIAFEGNSLVVGATNTSTDGPLIAATLHAANGVTGTFNVVQVVDGIVVGGA